MKRWMLASILLITLNAYASLTVPMDFINVDDNNHELGTIKLDDTPFGLLITPHLQFLPPGIHAFHINTGPSCNNGGRAAGDHFDPVKTNQHRGPYNGDGHLGDLPVLVVNQAGLASLPVLAPRLKLQDVKGLTILIDAESDNYQDEEKLQDAVAIACGAIPYF